MVGVAQSKQSASHAMFLHVCDCPHCIFQIAPVANKNPTLFCLKGAIGRWLSVAILETI